MRAGVEEDVTTGCGSVRAPRGLLLPEEGKKVLTAALGGAPVPTARLAIAQLTGERCVLDIGVPVAVKDVRPQITAETGFVAFELFVAGEEDPLGDSYVLDAALLESSAAFFLVPKPAYKPAKHVVESSSATVSEDKRTVCWGNSSGGSKIGDLMLPDTGVYSLKLQVVSGQGNHISLGYLGIGIVQDGASLACGPGYFDNDVVWEMRDGGRHFRGWNGDKIQHPAGGEVPQFQEGEHLQLIFDTAAPSLTCRNLTTNETISADKAALGTMAPTVTAGGAWRFAAGGMQCTYVIDADD
jgi:hypothetical protein